MSVSEFFSEFLKLIHRYGDVIVTDSHCLDNGRMSFNCHIMNPARIVDLLYFCLDINTRSSVDSITSSDQEDLPEDSYKKLIWTFFFEPRNNHKELNREIIPMTLCYFYEEVLRDLKNKKLIDSQEITHFETYIENIYSKLKG